MKIFIIVVLIANFACSDRAVNVDIPLAKNGKLSLFYTRGIPVRKYIGGLDSLESGYPTLQIRIWYEYGTHGDRNLVVIKKADTWIAEYYTYALEMRNDSVVLAKKIDKIF